ncbi:MAG TPA: Crp/Fnr family transcriptional regulator [Ignavibacteria bacterium]|nr:Crp/Fnr family transcriptional regulator [Ignavibacteria bacterium]
MKIQIEQPPCDKCFSNHDNVFCKLTHEQIKEMDHEKTCTIYPKNTNVFNEGNMPFGLYCINRGKIKVFQSKRGGKKYIIRLAKEGDILGYRALISGEAYTGTATVLEEATLCFVPKKLFFDFLKSNSDFSSKLIQLLSNDLKNTEKKLATMALKPVRERMAETLLMLNEFYGIDSEGFIKISISREDIANIVGTATETVIRILSEFKSEKMIELINKRIKIVDSEQLIITANIFD